MAGTAEGIFLADHAGRPTTPASAAVGAAHLRQSAHPGAAGVVSSKAGLPPTCPRRARMWVPRWPWLTAPA